MNLIEYTWASAAPYLVAGVGLLAVLALWVLLRKRKP